MQTASALPFLAFALESFAVSFPCEPTRSVDAPTAAGAAPHPALFYYILTVI